MKLRRSQKSILNGLTLFLLTILLFLTMLYAQVPVLFRVFLFFPFYRAFFLAVEAYQLSINPKLKGSNSQIQQLTKESKVKIEKISALLALVSTLVVLFF